MTLSIGHRSSEDSGKDRLQVRALTCASAASIQQTMLNEIVEESQLHDVP